MYYYGGGSSCPYYSYNYNSAWNYGRSFNYGYYQQGYGQGYSIILVLFILIAILFGLRLVRS